MTSSGSLMLQLHGLTETPLCLASSQLRGNRQLLINNPETVQIMIQPAKRRRGVPSPCWKLVLGRSFPDPSLTSPDHGNIDRPCQRNHAITFFRDVVYASVQHAFFSCLVWGLSNEIQYRFYPNGNKVAPLMCIDNPTVVGIQSKGSLAVHLMVTEPSHTRLLELASQLRCAGYTQCMLLIGTLTPKKAGKEAGGLRGLLLHVDQLVGADHGSGAYPPAAVEHGWKMCFDPKDGASLYFALNAQRSVDNSLEVMPLAELSVLANVGLRLWRRGDVAHAIVPKNAPSAADEWDESIKRFLEIPVE